MRHLLACLAILGTLSGAALSAGPPNPPGDFDQPQSAARPAPFPIRFIDHGQYDSRLKGYITPEGFRIEIVATEPVVVNPVGLTFGPDGTLFVMEWTVDPVTQGRWFEFKETFRYRDGSTKQVATMKKFVTDPVKVLRYNPASRTFDRAETIIAEELPSTLLYHDDWLYTASRGTVRRYRQSRPGGPWDIREIIAQGFCGFHHHQVSGLTIGNDGKLYITSGDDDNFAEGSDGSRATVLRTGAIFRCNPDGSQMEAYSLGYRNPYRDLAHDDRFNLFHADNDNEDGSKFTGCRLVHVAEGVDYGWRLKEGARCCRPDFVRGAIAGELPGKLAPMLKTGRGSPAGLLIYNDTRLPEQYRGLLYYPDVFRKLIRAYQVKPAGATFEVAGEFDFLKADDPLFRPCQMVTGPDGAIYVCDWRTDSGGAGRLSGDGRGGRIYRIIWTGTPRQPAIPTRGMDSWAKLVRETDAELVKALSAPDFSDRLLARNELVRRGGVAGRSAGVPPASDANSGRDARAPAETVRKRVLGAFISGGLSADGRLAAMGVLQPLWNNDVSDLFRLLLNDESADVRRLAADGLGLRAKPKDLETHDALVRLLSDESPAVRRSAALAAARVGNAGAADALVNAWKADDGKDAFLTDAYLRGLEYLGQPGIDALIAAAESGSHVERDRVAVAFTGLRTRPAADALFRLVANPHLLPGQRADLVRSFANYQFDPPLSLEPLAEFLAGRPDEAAPVRVAALDVFAGTGTAAGPKAGRYVIAQLDSADTEVRAAALRAVEEARLAAGVPRVLAILADSKRPADERVAALKAVRVGGDRSIVPPLRDLLGKPEPATLKVEVLRSLAAVDASAARTAARALLDQPDPGLLAEAVIVLGATKDGARLVGERFVAKRLPRELWPRVSESLKKFDADPAVAKLNADVTKGGLFLSTNPAELQKVREQVLTKGDPKRGKELYLNSTVLACVNCHQMEGVGGSVGPDLTRVWDTQTVDKLLEAIVQPSKEIKEGYQSFKATTADGQVFTGLRVSETGAEVILRDATGRDIRLPKTDVEEMIPSKVSLMPDDVISQLSYDQFIDLLAFLKSRPAQESLRGAVREFAVVGGFDPDLTKPQPPERVTTGAPASPGDGWQAAAVDAAGRLRLAPMLPAGKASAAYALTYVHTQKPQRVTAVLAADDAVRVWVGKDLAFERPAKVGLPGTDDRFTVDLPAGWSPVLVKVAANGTARSLGLTLLGDGLRIAAKPEGK